jgi:hypothetical protein
MEKESEEKREKVQRKKSVDENLSRIVITKEADMAVTEILDVVNQGFEAGSAKRFEVASHMILWFKEHAPTDAIQSLRRHLASGLSMLDAVAKKAKSSGELPPEIQAALAQYFFGDDAQPTKKVKKNLKQNSIKDTINESEAA